MIGLRGVEGLGEAGGVGTEWELLEPIGETEESEENEGERGTGAEVGVLGCWIGPVLATSGICAAITREPSGEVTAVTSPPNPLTTKKITIR